MNGSRGSFRSLPRAQQIALAITALGLLWTAVVLISGGIDTTIFGARLRSRRWTDPAGVALVAFLIFLSLRRNPAAAAARWLRSSANLLLLAILVVAAVTRFWALSFGLPHPAARPDEESVSAMAGIYYGGHFDHPDFTYPPVFILAVAATQWLVFRWAPKTLSRFDIQLGLSEDPSIAAQRMVARTLSAAAGLFSVWLLFRIGARLFGRLTGFAAAACLALAFLHVRDSHFGVTDIPMTFMVLAGLLAIVRLSETGSRRDLVASAVLTALAIATKYNAALLGLPAAFAMLNDPLNRPVANRLIRIVAFGVIVTVVFLIASPFSLLNHEKFIYDMRNVSRHLADGHGIDLGRGFSYHLTTTLRYGLGLPMLIAGILGLPLMIWREGRRGALVALFPVAYFLLIGSGRTVFARYALPLVPFLCLSAGYFVTTLAAAAASRVRKPGWLIPLSAVMTAAVIFPSARSAITFDRLIARDDSRKLAREWIEARFPPGTTVGQFAMSTISSDNPYLPYESNHVPYVLTDIASTSRPTVIVVTSSPFGGPDLAAVKPWLEAEYELQFVQDVVDLNDPVNIYDRQDEFYMPIAGFRIVRPGPNIRIYVRRDAARISGAS